MTFTADRILFEDNHIIAVNKNNHDIVQSDKTGDEPLIEQIKTFIKIRDKKPGNVFLEVIHRIDRPVSGVVLFAKTSKVLPRMNKLFHDGLVKKIYWAVVKSMPPKEKGTLTHYLLRNTKQNKSYVYDSPKPESKEARLIQALDMIRVTAACHATIVGAGVAGVLLDTGLPGLPVTEEAGVLIGFISRTDILRAVAADPPLDVLRLSRGERRSA